MTERNHVLPPEMPEEDPRITAAAQKEVITELMAKIQFLVDWMESQHLLEDHAFTFPDGDIWKAKDSETDKR